MADELHLTPLELIHRITAMAATPTQVAVVQTQPDAQPAATGDGTHDPRPLDNPVTPAPEPSPPMRPAHDLWAVLIARIYEVFALSCPVCGGQMRVIAFITHSADIRQILEHIGVDSEPLHITPARGPPLWDGVDTLLSKQGSFGSPKSVQNLASCI